MYSPVYIRLIILENCGKEGPTIDATKGRRRRDVGGS